MTLTRESFKTDKEFVAHVRSQLEAGAAKRGISKAAVFGLAEHESSWNVNAININKPKKKDGSIDESKITTDAGVLQVNSQNWGRFGFKSKDDLTGKNWEKGMNAGLDIFAEQLKAFNGNTPLALAAYNAGGGTVRNWQRGISELPKSTRNYVPLVIARAQKYGEKLSNGDMASVTELFKPTKSLEKIAKAAGIKNIMPEAEIGAATNAAIGFVPQPQLADLQIAQQDTADELDAQDFAFPEASVLADFSIPDDLDFSPPAKTVATADNKASQVAEIKLLRDSINKAFMADDEYDENGAVESYLEGLMDA